VRFLFLVLTCSTVCASPEVHFSPGGIQSHLVSAIDGTRRSLDVALYELSARPLIGALKRAGERGVAVRLILDEEVLREHPQDKTLAGVRHVSLRTLGGREKRRGMMHNKFAVFDAGRVVTGSYNWSQGAEYVNYENALFEDDAAVVRAYAAQFAALWAHARPVSPGTYLNPVRKHGKNRTHHF
jgi:phosphatidylserine/phosphatidylglycerophosphate/cardiolipin synthase-like enzyme